MTLQLGTLDQSLPGGLFNIPVTAYSHQKFVQEKIDSNSEESEIEQEQEKEQQAEIVVNKAKTKKPEKKELVKTSEIPIYEDYLPDIEGSVKLEIEKYFKQITQKKKRTYK